jgi:hydroxypyruvate isomerase
MLRFSANVGFLWAELPLLDRVTRAKAAGFDAVEFHYPYETPPEQLTARLAETGLPALGVNTHPGNVAAGDLGLAAVPGREAEARAVIDQAIAYAEAIGAGHVHVMAGRPGENDAARARRTFLDALDYAAGRAGPTMRIVIEPLNHRDAPGYFLRSTVQAAELIAELQRPNVKLMFDCYHTQINEGDLTRRLETLWPIIGHIQIAAAPSRREPDEGEIAYERLFDTIEGMGFSGFIGAEYRPRGGVEDGLSWLENYRAARR